jgi:dihydropyrimidinase
MSEYELVIRGATIATAADVVQGDIGVSGGRVVALGERLARGHREIDARGMIATPGGIDAHVHFDQDMPDGALLCDDFESGSRAAAAGGTTTIIPFAFQQRGQSLRAAVDEYHRRAAGKALVDYAFHVILTDPSERVMGQDFPALVADGYTSFKIYMTYDGLKLSDRQILDALVSARREQAILMIHAENTDSIEWLTERLERKGFTAPKHHAASRPFVVEREATHRAISLSELLDVPMLLVHVSAKEAMREIQRAQARGLRIYGETCPQYLFLSEEDFDKPGDEGSKCVCSPPPRGRENQEHLWTGLASGAFHVVSSDHAAFRYDDQRGKKLPGAAQTFRRIPNGVPGVETRLPLLFSEGVNRGRITLQQFVALTSTNPARIYGLHPRKGTIAIGADADIVLWDPAKKIRLSNDLLHHNCDYTPYEGIELTGYPAMTLARGEIVFEGGRVTGDAGRGRFLRCDRPEAARPRGRPVVDPALLA